jgi:iron(III) transport system ATP-binding protein
LIAGTNLVLFDEPLSNVDAQVRERLRDELMEMQQAFNFASIFVTHDRQEAMVLADRIAVLNGGVIRQLDAPAVTYRHPADRFVAHFIGPTNELKTNSCEVHEDGKAVAMTELGRVHGTQRGNPTSSLIAAWRPEAGMLTREEPGAVNQWRCTVDRVLFYGSQAELTIKVANLSFRVLSDGGRTLPVGSDAWLSVDPQDVQFLADQ